VVRILCSDGVKTSDTDGRISYAGTCVNQKIFYGWLEGYKIAL